MREMTNHNDPPKCLLCQGDSVTLLYDRARNNQHVDNFFCHECGFIFIYPRPSLAELTSLYEGGSFSRCERKAARPDARKISNNEHIALQRFN
jgi:hypothetical protein